jgi:methionyl-tRNA formyltransferase
LDRAKHAAFNFHPGSPDYPGIGCLNFELYEEAREYGVTCHHMVPKVDTGGIIAVKHFAIFDSDCVASLLARLMTINSFSFMRS